MNKNFKIIQIQGLSGLLLLGLISTGVFCGFVLFPIWVTMVCWNNFIVETLKAPGINYFQAALLWSAIMLSIYILLRNSISIQIKKSEPKPGVDIDEIMKEIKEKDLLNKESLDKEKDKNSL